MQNKILQIELTNHCNGNCWWCNHSKMKRDKGFISTGFLDKILEKIKDRQDTLYLHHFGESSLHPNFYEIIDLVARYNIKPILSTNGYFLNDESIEKIKNSKLHEIYLPVNRFYKVNEIKKLIKETKNLKIIIMLLNLPKTDNDCGYIDGKKFIEDFKNLTNSRVKVYVKKYEKPKDLSMRGARQDCMMKEKDGTCKLRKENKYCVLWDGRLTSCCKDYDCNDYRGEFFDLDKLKNNSNVCPF